MTRLRLAAVVGVLTMSAVGLVGAVETAAGAAGSTPPDVAASTVVSHAVDSAESGPLRDMPRTASSDESKRSLPLRLVSPSTNKPGGGGGGGKPGGGGGGGTAGAGSDGSAFPGTVGTGAQGIGVGLGTFSPDAAPPDTNGAAGADANGGTRQYVQWVNEDLAVWAIGNGNSLTLLSGYPKPGNGLFAALAGGPGAGCAATNDGDPIAQFDKIAHRWVLTQFSVSAPSTYGYLQCVAVSDSADATGSYHVYAFSYGSSAMNDYPKLGVWPDAYYVTYDIFTNGSSYAGPRVCAWDRAAMVAGSSSVTEVCRQLSTSYGPLLPGDLDGTTASGPEPLASFTANALQVWDAQAAFGSSPSLTLRGPATLSVPSFSEACGGGTCIPQPRGQLDSLADRLMYRLAYRVIGTTQHLLVNHSVQTSTAASGVRWYDLTRTTGGWSVTQSGTYSPDGTSRWMGSMAMDKNGSIAVGYSASSSSVYPSIRAAARLTSTAGGLLSNEATLKGGGGSEFGYGLTRWGDYSAMSVDPADDCTMWFTTEYEKTTGAWNWSTWITPITLGSC